MLPVKGKIIYSLLSFVFFIGLIGGLYYWIILKDSDPHSNSQSIQKNIPAKNFTLKDKLGKGIALKDFKGEVILLHFWASWCPPCIDELPDLLELAKKMNNSENFKIFAVNLDKTWEDAMSVFPERGVPNNVISVMDKDGTVANQYGSYQYPETYLINKDFNIVMKWVGPQQWRHKSFFELMKRYL